MAKDLRRRIQQAVTGAAPPADLSYAQRRTLLQDAVKERFSSVTPDGGLAPDGHGMGPWIADVFDDRVIVEDGKGGYFEIGYTIADDKAALGADMTAVERKVDITYPAVQESGRLLQAVEGKEGWAWDVVLIKAGTSKTNDHFPVATLAAAVSVFEGARAFALDQGQHVKNSLDKAVKDIVGWYSDVKMVGDEMRARLNLLKTAVWLRDMLVDSFAKGKTDLLGLSIDAGGDAYKTKMGGQDVRYWTAIKETSGVDVVWDPAAGGAFVKVLAASAEQRSSVTLDHLSTKEDAMKEKLLKILQARRPDLYKTIDPATITDEALEALVQQAIPTEPAPAAAIPSPPALPGAGAPAAAGAQAVAVEQRILQADSRSRLRDALAESKLPDLVQARIKKRFDGQVVEDAAIQQAIKDERDYLGELTTALGDESGTVRGFGETRIAVEGESTRLQMAMHKLFKVPGDDVNTSDIAPFEGLRQAYERITGDKGVSGRLPAQRIQQAVTSATFANLLANTLYRRLIADYREQDYGERNIITVGSAPDFRTREAIRIGYFGDIATVDPETGDYQEIAAPGDEKVSYAVTQRGNLLTITRKTIINDDLRGVTRLVGRLGRAARRTFARFVWNFAISNSTYDADATAWFHANHTNLGSTALAAAEIEVVITALANMTEPNSGEKLGLPGSANVAGMRLWLVVPRALLGTAKKENEREYLDANFTPNPVRHVFGMNSERIIVLDLLTDVTDWYVFRDASDIESIGIDFLGGQEEPEFFLADQPTVGQMFVADKLQYKIRHEYGGDILDYRGAYKEVVAG
jgi:hypothetical protein